MTTLDETAKSIAALQGAVHMLVLSLVEKESIGAQKAVEVLEMLSSGSDAAAKIIQPSLEPLKKLALLDAKGS